MKPFLFLHSLLCFAFLEITQMKVMERQRHLASEIDNLEESDTMVQNDNMTAMMMSRRLGDMVQDTAADVQNSQRTISKDVIAPGQTGGQTVSETPLEYDEHLEWMTKAYELACEAMSQGEVPVGCIIVYNSQIIGRGRNEVNETKNATRHAELIAIDGVKAWSKTQGIDPNAVFNDSTLYVTVEPCVMCAAALRLRRLRQIVFGCHNDRFGGCGSVMDVAQDGGNALGLPLNCVSGILADKAVQLLKDFYRKENPNAPNPKKKDNR